MKFPHLSISQFFKRMVIPRQLGAPEFSKTELEDNQVKSETHFRLLVESIKDYAIFILDPKGHVLTWNKGAQTLKGYLPSEIIGKYFSIFYPQSDVDTGKCEMELEVATAKGSFEDYGWRLRKDGSRFWANVIITAVRDSDDKLIGFAKVTRDLTKARMAEEKLLSSELRLKEAQALAHVGSWEWDIPSNKISWSDELYRIFGIEKTSFDPSYEGYVERLNPDERDFISETIQYSLKTGRDFTFEHKVVHPDGNVRYVHARGRVILNPETKTVLKMVGTAQDITDRKMIERELRKSQTELEDRVRERTAQLHDALERERRATEAKMQFLANMSHEIRTPMNAIIGFSTLLKDEALSEQQTAYLARIETNGQQLLRLIDDILDLSKFESGQIPVEKIKFSVPVLINDVINSFSPITEKKRMSVDVRFLSPIPQYIESDLLRIRQVLMNLLGNSLKFTDSGHVALNLAYENGQLRIETEDSGIGISSEDQKKLFSPFGQADSSISRKFGGTGLGLVLSRHIAKSLGGNVRLKSSEPSKGSTFEFVLTVQPAEGSPMISTLKGEAPVLNMPIASKSKYGNVKPMNILLVEDSADNVLLVQEFLKFDGVNVEVASDGFQALEKGMHGNFDLILMDIQMPGMDGLEATRQLRANGFKKPIIALTAHALKKEVEKSIQAGCDFHLTKPIQRRDLIDTIQSQLQ